jgi:hypothetical protein
MAGGENACFEGVGKGILKGMGKCIEKVLGYEAFEGFELPSRGGSACLQ